MATSYGSRAVTRPGQPGREIRNVVVAIDGLKGIAPARAHEMRQQDELFVPRVLAIGRGSTVAFPNGDPYFHNVFSLSRVATFDLGRYPPGQSRVRSFAKPGLVKVFCHLHSHMSAAILVFDHPWFVVPDEAGSFELDAVPAGERVVTAWHERIGEARKTVAVQAGGEASIEFVLPVIEP
jgi:plastocyanin